MKYRFYAFLLCFLPSVSLFAQEIPARKNAIKVNVLSPIFGTLNISYQHLFPNNKSLNFGVSYTDFSNFNDDIAFQPWPYAQSEEQDRTKGATATLEYRMHFSDNKLSGWYAAPFARFMYYERNFRNNYSSYDPVIAGYTTVMRNQNNTAYSAGIGFIAGYQFVFRNTVTIDFFGGPVYQILLSKSRRTSSTAFADDNYLSTSIPNRYLEGYGMRGGITVGLCF